MALGFLGLKRGFENESRGSRTRQRNRMAFSSIKLVLGGDLIVLGDLFWKPAQVG